MSRALAMERVESTEARAIRADVCHMFGVTDREFRYGSRIPRSGRHPAQHSVSLARYLCLFKLWSAEIDAEEAGLVLGITTRCARHWYRDFRLRKARPA